MSNDSPIKVLVIEDEPDARENLRDLLLMDGYAPEAAASFTEADAREDWPEIDIVLLDRKLEDGHADERLETLRERAPQAFIIVVTGYEDLGGTLAAIRHGVSDYLLKPVNPEMLRLRLGHCVQMIRARQTEAHLSAIVRDSSDAIVSATPEGIITSWNDGAVRLYGYTATEAIGRSVAMLTPSESGDEWRALTDRVARGERINHIETIRVRKDGSRVPVSLALSPIRGQSGTVIGVSAIVRDLSERRALERQVLEASTREQRRIGQDLHDGLGQELTGLSFLADDLAEELEEKEAPEAEQLRSIAQQLSEAVTHAKSLVRGLRPVHLENGGLSLALSDLAQHTQQVHGIVCRYDGPASDRLPDPEVAMHLYYIVREAVHNAVQHGRARRIDIELSEEDGRLTLTIRDDGAGLPPEGQRKAGSGLDIMAYRANLIGANFEVDSPSRKGTTVQCVLEREVPMPAE